MALYPTNGIHLEAQLLGPTSGVPLLLVRGLGSQLIHWPARMLDRLVERGFHVCIFDNRDAGLSDAVETPYTTTDMALDVVGLLDALGWDTAHVAGGSLGGTIVQRCAIDFPDRFRSVTSMWSGSRVPFPGEASAAARQAIAASPSDPNDRDEVIDLHIRGSFAYEGTVGQQTMAETAAIETAAYDRAYRPEGVARQAATLADFDVRDQLGTVRIPFHVIHGSADPLVPVDAGRETAALVEGAIYTELEGLGHVLGPYWAEPLADTIADFICTVEDRS